MFYRQIKYKNNRSVKVWVVRLLEPIPLEPSFQQRSWKNSKSPRVKESERSNTCIRRLSTGYRHRSIDTTRTKERKQTSVRRPPLKSSPPPLLRPPPACCCCCWWRHRAGVAWRRGSGRRRDGGRRLRSFPSESRRPRTSQPEGQRSEVRGRRDFWIYTTVTNQTDSVWDLKGQCNILANSPLVKVIKYRIKRLKNAAHSPQCEIIM